MVSYFLSDMMVSRLRVTGHLLLAVRLLAVLPVSGDDLPLRFGCRIAPAVAAFSGVQVAPAAGTLSEKGHPVCFSSLCRHAASGFEVRLRQTVPPVKVFLGDHAAASAEAACLQLFVQGGDDLICFALGVAQYV